VITVNLDIGGRRPSAEILDAAGIAWTHRFGGPDWLDEDTRAVVTDVDAILAGNERLDATTLDHAQRLQVVARNGVGYDRVDVDYCTQRGIVVTYTPGVMAAAVADLTFGLLLAVVRGIAVADRGIKAGAYEVAIGEDLSSMSFGLLGCGRIGAEVVRRAQGFGMRVLVHDPWADAERLRSLGVEAVDLDGLLTGADIISLHLPMTQDNARIVDADFLRRMRPRSVLVNTARGGLVDEPALMAALRDGHLSGAGLDCQATEPPVGASADLVALEQVVATPHSGSKTITARIKMAELATQTMVDVLQGRRPEHVVNPEVFERRP
jgi:phosphoglycerate dehydrogenase-like enzyme